MGNQEFKNVKFGDNMDVEEKIQKLKSLYNPEIECCGWDMWILSYASSYDHLDILIWERDHNPDKIWDKVICANAARNGHLDILWYLYTSQEPYSTFLGIHDSCTDFFEKYGKDWESRCFELNGRNIKG